MHIGMMFSGILWAPCTEKKMLTWNVIGIHFVVGRVLHMDRFHSSTGIRLLYVDVDKSSCQVVRSPVLIDLIVLIF